MSIYRISDLNIEIITHSPMLAENIKRYAVEYQEQPNITLAISDDVLLELMEENEGVTAELVEATYISTLYCWSLFDFNGFPIRATAVEHEGRCVLFAAPFIEDFDPVNDLKIDGVFTYNYPGIRIEGDDFYVFDTPFGINGKYSKTGKKLKLEAIVFIDPSRFDSLKRLEAKDFVPMFMRAVAMNIRHERTKHTLFILEKVMHKVQFYGIKEVSPLDVDFILDRV